VTRMTVITKTFAPDFDLCMSLNRSVLENSPDSIQHHVVVPRSDLKLFDRLAGPRTHIRCEADFLPRTFVRLPLSNVMVNLGRPFPPVRGWIQQQVIKLAAIAASGDDVVLVADSDVEFVRPFRAEMFVRDGAVRFFRNPDQIDKRLSRHMTWHRVARELLGLPPAQPPYPDYISSPLAWDPVIVRQMLTRVAAVTGRPWPSAIAGQLDFSECVLHGVFIDEVIGVQAKSFVSDDPLCRVYWDGTPLNADGAVAFIAGIRPSDVAVVIQSKSRTTPAVREAIFSTLSGRAMKGPGPLGQARKN
jgi:Family of unknown function (DUF6492)